MAPLPHFKSASLSTRRWTYHAMNLFFTDGPSNNSKPMPPAAMSTFTTPPTRDSIKTREISVTARAKRKEALKEFGRRQRHAILQQHRHSLSPLDLKGKLHADTMAAIRAQLQVPEVDGGILTDADIDALLQDMEVQIMEEIQAEVAELERQEQEQLQHAADTVEQHMQYLQQQQQQHTGPGAGSVLCPVCKSCQLVQRQGLLVCPSEGWRLNLAKEGVSMDTIMTNLATAYEEHAASGCPGQLSFQIEDIFGSGDSLTCSCAICSGLSIVV